MAGDPGLYFDFRFEWFAVILCVCVVLLRLRGLYALWVLVWVCFVL